MRMKASTLVSAVRNYSAGHSFQIYRRCNEKRLTCEQFQGTRKPLGAASMKKKWARMDPKQKVDIG